MGGGSFGAPFIMP